MSEHENSISAADFITLGGKPRKRPCDYSTGPRSPDGKHNSSQNSLKHGCCSKQLIVAGENPEEFKQLLRGWFEEYEPANEAAESLVREVAEREWYLLRTERWYNHCVQSIAAEEPDPMLWTEAHHKSIERFTRYRTTAERAFSRALNDLERFRRARNLEFWRERNATERTLRDQAKAERKSAKSHSQATASAQNQMSNLGVKSNQQSASRASGVRQGKKTSKKREKISVLDQWIEVRIEDGKTITEFYPSNEKLIEEGQAMDPLPDLVYRRLNFLDGIPPEYAWTSNDPDQRAQGGCGIQRMTIDAWLQVIENEKLSGTGHIGPTGVGNLPRPKERGGCECPLCTQNAGMLDRWANGELPVPKRAGSDPAEGP